MKVPNILIVDDEETNIKLIKTMLRRDKYNIFECHSGKEALDTVYSTKPDLILLDILMPEVDGFEVCRRLKKDDRTKIIPVIMVTALKERENRKIAMNLGANDFLNKPIDQLELIVRVKSNLRIKFYHDKLISSNFRLSKKNKELECEIIKRKGTEEALRQSEEKYRLLVNHAPAGIYEVDIKNTRFISVNDIMCEYTGYTREELLDLKPNDLFTEDSKKLAIERQQKVLAGQYLPELIESKIRCKDGSKLWAMFNSKVLYENGKPKRITVVLHDITKLKQAEEEKMKLENQLQQAQKMKTIGLVAGGVAHDLNNILSGILTYPELLLMNLSQNSPLRKPIETIHESGKKATAIVQDLLTLARRGVAVSEVVNLNDIISEYLISPEFEKLKLFHPLVEVKTDFTHDLLSILGSPVHLSKTIMNLVSNAAEAMLEGGSLTISTQNRYIDLPVNGYDEVREGDYVVLEISDTGIGIPAEDIDQIFQPFYTKKIMGRSGTGLGMAVVWGTVKDHKGYIDVQSAQGKGTTVTIDFPVTRKESNRNNTIFEIEDYKGQGESILVIDDVKEQREIANKILSQLDYSVKTVSSGEEAIKYMENNTADLIVLDMIMDPGIDGQETYKQILTLHPKQKTIIASGYSETDRVKAVQRLGAIEYIKKPYTIEKIGLAIKSELNRDFAVG